MTDIETHMREELHWKGGYNKKWKVRRVTLEKRETNGTYFLTITSGSNRLSNMLARSRSAEDKAVELGPSIAVLHMEKFEGRKNVLGLIQVDKDGSQMLLSCDCSVIFTELKNKVQQCCRGDSFQVTIGEHQTFPQGEAVLHIFQDQLYLLARKRDALVAPVGQWKIISQQQIMLIEHGVMLNMTESSEPYWLLLNTEEGGEIISLFRKHVNYHCLPIKRNCIECDINSNTNTEEEWVPRWPSKTTPSVDGYSSSTSDGSRLSSSSSSSSSQDSQEQIKETMMPVPDTRPEENIVNVPGEEQSNPNEGTNNTEIDGIEKDHSRHPPTCYVYINQTENSRDHTKGTSIKHCYENLNYVLDQHPPALHPRMKPPEIPPRGVKHEGVPPLPPRRPTKPPCPPRPSHNTQVQVAVFASDCIQEKRTWFLRVAVMCKDSDDGTMRRVKDHEAQSNHHFLKSQPLLVESDIKISLLVESKGFVDEDSEDFQCVEFGDVKNLRPGDWFVIEFHLQNNGKEPQFSGKVLVGPTPLSGTDHCGATRRLKIGISETFVTDSMMGQSAALQPASPSLPPRCLEVISSYEKRRAICRALDMTLQTENNWKLVAEKLGLSLKDICEFDDKAHRSAEYSPMETVLKMWEQRDPSKCTWEALKKILQDINRQDIIEDVEQK